MSFLFAKMLSICLLGQSGKPASFTQKLVDSAKDQLTWGTKYNPKYFKIKYPNGDVPRQWGVCTDVIIRAYRGAGIDLQQLIHQDMGRHWGAYPRYAGLKLPDPNIDHRRVKNMRVFFTRSKAKLPNDRDFQPGDIVTWVLPGNLDHVGIVTNTRGPQISGKLGNWLIIHNLNVPAEEDCLHSWPITGHYRYRPQAAQIRAH